jgi:hypothetical protein
VATSFSDPLHNYTSTIMLYVGWAVILVTAVVLYALRERWAQCGDACKPLHKYLADVLFCSFPSLLCAVFERCGDVW